MKKTKIFCLLGLVAILAACGTKSYEAKSVQLNNQNDSLNYTLGLANGDGIKNYYLKNDSTPEVTINAFVVALEKEFKGEAKKETEDQMFELGKNIGSYFKQQEKEGLVGNPDLAFNMELVMQGLINTLSKYEDGMTAEEARAYFQATLQEVRSAQN